MALTVNTEFYHAMLYITKSENKVSHLQLTSTARYKTKSGVLTPSTYPESGSHCEQEAAN